MELFEHQIDNSKRLVEILETNRGAVDLSDMGVGKTITALNVAKTMKKPILVVCPKSIISNWQDSIEEIGFEEESHVTNYEQIRANKDHRYYVPVGRTFQWRIDPNTLVIFDEAHRLKSYSSKISKICRTLECKCLMLSATLAVSPLEMRCVGTILEMFTWSQFFAWIQLNGCQRKPRFGGFEYKWENNRWRDDLRVFSVCTKIDEVRDDMKDNLIQNKIIPISNTKVVKQAFDRYEELAKKKDAAKSALESLCYALQICELEKIGYFKDRIYDNFLQNYKSIVFLNYRNSQECLMEALDTLCVRSFFLNGDSSDVVRENTIRDFMHRKIDCIILTYGTCGEGISLDDREGDFKRIVMLSPNWSGIKMKQALGRAYRATTKSDVVQQIVFAKGTLEERVAECVMNKLISFDKLGNENLFDIF